MAAILGMELSKSFRHYPVLEQVTFEIAPGDCFALFGANGAGKTTLLKILSTLERPTGGRFEVMGFDGVRQRQQIREVLLFLAHGSYLYNDMDAIENIRFALGLRGLQVSDREMKLVLDRVGIGAFSDFKVRYFSEGMKKRLAIARAILIRPAVLLMDEPYSSLDEKGMGIVNDFLRESLKRGAAVMMSSHNRVKSAEVATRAGIMKQGRLRDLPLSELVAAHELF